MALIASTPVDQMDRPYPRRWCALGVLCLSLLVVVMANTSLIVAAPAMTRDLGLSASQLQWVIDGYTVPYAALLLAFGAVGDKYSRRGGLVAGLGLFCLGAVMGGLVHTTGLVIAARVVMGLGAAAIMPATLSLLAATFPRNERGRAITAWSATSGLAVAAGPLLAGWLLQAHAWGSTFLVNVPIAVVAALGALVVVPPSKAGGMGRLDLVGGALSICSVGALVYAVIQGPNFGWGAGPVAAAAGAGLGLIAFALWELRQPNPVMDVRKFSERAFAGPMLAVLMFFFGVIGVVYCCVQQLQFVFGYSALSTGARLLPLAGAVFLGAAVTGRLVPKLGERVMVTAGMAIGTTGVLLLTGVSASSSYGDFVVPFALLGFAIGLSLSPCTDLIMGLFPETQLGVAGGLNDTALELGTAFGVAVLGSTLATAYRSHLAGAVANQLPAPALAKAKESIGEALAVARQVAQSPLGGPVQAHRLVVAADQSFALAVSHSSAVAGVGMGIATVAVALLVPGRRPPRRRSRLVSLGEVGHHQPTRPAACN